MKNKMSSGIWGMALVILGVLYTGNTLDAWNFTLFFDGFWTLFIIIPSLISILSKGVTLFPMVMLILGSMWLLSAQNILQDGVIGKMIFPLILIVMGIQIVIKNFISTRYQGNRISHNQGKKHDYTAIFGAGEYHLMNEVFYGASTTAIFGAVDLDLRDAIIEEDVVININSIFGAVDIMVPPNVRVETKGVPIFGGIENHSKENGSIDSPVVYLNITCLFAGVEIS